MVSNVARVYDSVVLIKSVLSAVDAHTAHAIMENCLAGPITADRTILLVSHHTALVAPSASYIVALENVSPLAIAFAALIKVILIY